MDTETNKAIVRRLYEEAFNHDGDLAAIDEFAAVDMVDHAGPPGLPPGREGFRHLVAHWRDAIPDIRLTIEALVAGDDLVALAWTGTGTQRGTLMGIPPTNRAGWISGISLNRIADGRIAERWGNSDDLGLLQRLGVFPGESPAQPPMPLVSAPIRATDTASGTGADLVRRFYTALDAGDLAVVPTLIDPAWTNVDPAMPPLTGHDGARTLIALLHDAFPDLHTTIDSLIVEGDLVAARLTHVATHQGNFLGIPATGRAASVTASGIFQVRDGRLVENRVIFDALGLLQQLGVVPQPANA